MKRLLVLSIGAAVAAIGIHSTANADNTVTIAAASPSGLYYAAGDAICRAMSADFQRSKTGCAVTTSRGSAANVLKLDAKELQFGIVQSDVQFHAVEGRDVFAFVGAAQDLRSVLSLHAEAFTVLVRAEATYSGIDDLRGKRLNLGLLGAGTRDTAEDLLDALGWSAADRANITSFEPEQNGMALCGGKVDAVSYLVGHPSANIQMVSKACPTRLLSLQPASIEKLIQNKPYYATVSIPGGLYSGNPNPTLTFGVTATLVTLRQVPDDRVFALVQSVFENFEDLRKASPAFSTLDTAQMIRTGLTAPLHSGAVKYYRQKGWMNAKDEANGQATARTGSSPPKSLQLDENKIPETIVIKPAKIPIAPTPELGTDAKAPSPVPAPVRTKEKWERDVSPF